MTFKEDFQKRQGEVERFNVGPEPTIAIGCSGTPMVESIWVTGVKKQPTYRATYNDRLGAYLVAQGWWWSLLFITNYITSSARTSRGRKFPKGKELYSKEKNCL